MGSYPSYLYSTAPLPVASPHPSHQSAPAALPASYFAPQLLLQCCRVSSGLCEAAVLAGAPDALLTLREGANGTLSLLALTALLEGLHARRGGGGAAAAQNALAVPQATDDALRRLAGG